MGVDYRQYSREQAEVIVGTTIFCPVASNVGAGAGVDVGDSCLRRR
jgi:hypothetical protein